MEGKNDVASRIKDIRLSKGWTLEQLGEKLGASKVSVHNWESGRNLPNKKRLKQIAELGEISIDELLYGDSEARIKSVLLDQSNMKEDYIPFVIAHFNNTGEKYPPEEKIIEKYNDILHSVESTAERKIAQLMLGYNIRLVDDYLSIYLSDPDKDKEYTFVKQAIQKITEAVGNYEAYFEKTVDEVYQEVIELNKK